MNIGIRNIDLIAGELEEGEQITFQLVAPAFMTVSTEHGFKKYAISMELDITEVTVEGTSTTNEMRQVRIVE